MQVTAIWLIPKAALEYQYGYHVVGFLIQLKIDVLFYILYPHGNSWNHVICLMQMELVAHLLPSTSMHKSPQQSTVAMGIQKIEKLCI